MAIIDANFVTIMVAFIIFVLTNPPFRIQDTEPLLRAILGVRRVSDEAESRVTPPA
jgi:hypothetical protein